MAVFSLHLKPCQAPFTSRYIHKKIHGTLGALSKKVEAFGQKRVGQRSFTRRRSQRTYVVAAYDRLSKDYRFPETTADAELYPALRIMRDRSRKLYEEVFQAWLPMAIASGALDLPMSAKDKWADISWQPRGWGWVDPDKEIKAKERSVSNSFESLYDVVAETDRDLDAVLEANARAKDHGLKLPVF